MAFTLSTPVNLMDIAQCMGTCHPIAWKVAKLQLAQGSSWALHDDAGELVSVAGLFPWPNGDLEAWWMVTPKAEISMLQIVRSIRLTLEASEYGEIYTLVQSKAGGRVARLAGFELVETIDNLEIWQYGRSDRRRRRQGRTAISSEAIGPSAAPAVGCTSEPERRS
ncbi:hypothetical protein [Pseudovibrio sp. POLY-S9]|uniref:hypothetical protein n=1 Tax=Pseudovibrio sp. POLY-S9 TaxID=1576596 RepID=UPI000709D47E|nr:hypothetical protein [Pseudovibrio sp. POLY-S9]